MLSSVYTLFQAGIADDWEVWKAVPYEIVAESLSGDDGGGYFYEFAFAEVAYEGEMEMGFGPTEYS